MKYLLFYACLFALYHSACHALSIKDCRLLNKRITHSDGNLLDLPPEIIATILDQLDLVDYANFLKATDSIFWDLPPRKELRKVQVAFIEISQLNWRKIYNDWLRLNDLIEAIQWTLKRSLINQQSVREGSEAVLMENLINKLQKVGIEENLLHLAFEIFTPLPHFIKIFQETTPKFAVYWRNAVTKAAIRKGNIQIFRDFLHQGYLTGNLHGYLSVACGAPTSIPEIVEIVNLILKKSFPLPNPNLHSALLFCFQEAVVAENKVLIEWLWHLSEFSIEKEIYGLMSRIVFGGRVKSFKLFIEELRNDPTFPIDGGKMGRMFFMAIKEAAKNGNSAIIAAIKKCAEQEDLPSLLHIESKCLRKSIRKVNDKILKCT